MGRKKARSRDTPKPAQPMNHEQEKVVGWLKKTRFKRALIGGVRESDVWKKIGELNALYEAALSAERARYDALLAAEQERCGALLKTERARYDALLAAEQTKYDAVPKAEQAGNGAVPTAEQTGYDAVPEAKQAVQDALLRDRGSEVG